jgi:formate dehydrogenase gamma subunit
VVYAAIYAVHVMPNSVQHSAISNQRSVRRRVRAPVLSSQFSVLSLLALIASLALGVTSSSARAADPENCLSCHRYRGLGRVSEDGEVHLYHVGSDYYDRGLGPHARLRCTDCHTRSEVEVIPHQPVSPVNCANACHLVGSGGTEVEFSHAGIAGMLETSVHKLETLNKVNELLGKPLREGQARCLLCHDEPTFRRSGQYWVEQEAPLERCNVCHGPQLPVNTQFMYWHVTARSQPARSHADVTRSCAVCHSDTRVREAFKLPDTTSSYLASFHGKAMMLGSETTANCLDCHVGQFQNVHQMQSPDEKTSPTNSAHLADTCRSPQCHPTAGAQLSSAADPLDLSTGGIEYFIAAIFVVLILFTFGPSVVLQAMEMLQIVIGRHDTQQHQHEALARKLLAEEKGRAALTRFSVHQRFQHWTLAICFTLLVLTGFPLKFANRGWARWLMELIGGIDNARKTHRYAGVILMLGFGYHMLYALISAVRIKRATGKGWIKTILDLPMLTNPNDLKQLFHQLAFLFFIKKTRPALPRFSLKEKFEYFGVFWGSALLGVTGILMWANAWTTLHLPGRVLTLAALIHTFEAFLALLHVGIIHMVGVIFSPMVFPLSHAMTRGDTPVEELAEAHAGLLHDAAKKLGIEPTAEVHHG